MVSCPNFEAHLGMWQEKNKQKYVMEHGIEMITQNATQMKLPQIVRRQLTLETWQKLPDKLNTCKTS